jgi:hypothetical protein
MVSYKTRKQYIEEFVNEHWKKDYAILPNAVPPRKYQTCAVCLRDGHKQFYGWVVDQDKKPREIKVAVTLEEFEAFKLQKKKRALFLATARENPNLEYIGKECGNAVKVGFRKKKNDTEKNHCVIIEDDL